MNNFWISQVNNEEQLQQLMNETGLSRSIASLLLALHITSKEKAEQFLQPTFKQLHNPFTVFDMQKAVERISRAIDNGERILFHGDYDADGVTTIAVAKRGFTLLGVDIDFYAPNRFDDGYGLNPRNMEKFAQEYDLIITGDTGIRDFAGAQKVKESGRAELIITDHHEPFVRPIEKLDEAPDFSVTKVVGDQYIALPDAYAVIDPHRIDDTHACKTHAGVGVIFKVMFALFRHRNQPVQPLLQMLDLVATGTIADLAKQIDRSHDSLDFEVRVMCAAGIQIMNETPSLWVQALKEACGLSPESTVTSETIGFIFGPTLNAVGRLYDPLPAAELLLEDDLDVAREIAKELREINQERKEQTKAGYLIMDELREEGDETRHDYGIVVHSDSYGEGIAGLVAEKLKSGFYRPAIALTTAEVDGKIVYKGSARSIPGIHILDMLDEVQREIGPFRYGGHDVAAGMSIDPSQFEAFQQAFRKACMKHDKDVFIPTYTYQSELELDELNDSFMNTLSRFEPFGESNKKPTFRVSNVLVNSIKEHKNGKGFNLMAKKDRKTMKAMSFDLAPIFLPVYKEELRAKKEVYVDLLFQPSYNEWQGETTLQLNIIDMKLSSVS